MTVLVVFFFVLAIVRFLSLLAEVGEMRPHQDEMGEEIGSSDSWTDRQGQGHSDPDHEQSGGVGEDFTPPRGYHGRWIEWDL